MLITPGNLLLIGYTKSKDNPNIYLRGNEMWDFNPSMVDFINRVTSSERTEEDAKMSAENYNSFKERIENEIKLKLGL